MIDTERLYNQLGIEKDLVTDFSIVFARFEYALKRSGFATSRYGHVRPDWNAFVAQYEESFNPGPPGELADATVCLVEEPPQIQVLDGGVLGWRQNENDANASLLSRVISSVRRTRNNLFHGGKFPHASVEDPGRDRRLLGSCMVVLEHCLSLNEALSRYFLGSSAEAP